uniref:Nipped-B protein n=1 Tax=Gongylonema pulchrum TaxID=637853 RepID=A0A183EAM9_9BILA
LTREEVRRMYINLLRTDLESYRRLKKAALRNLELFLNVQETKMVKDNTEWQSTKDEHDLKEMELANSGLASAIIQVYWSTILNSYYTDCSDVRMDVVRVVTLTLKQGLVTPGSSIPTLIAMSTDPEPRIRSSVERALRDIDSKYSGMVMSKAITGIRQAFRLRKILKIDANNIVRGIRSLELLPTPSTSGRLPEDKRVLFECMKNSQACFILLYLKSFLMKLYGFTDAKLQEYSPSEAAKVYEKAVNTRRNMAMFNPQSALLELSPEAALKRDTVAGHIEMASQIVAYLRVYCPIIPPEGYGLKPH